MNNSMERARQAAAKALRDSGRELPLSAEDAGLATAAYISSLNTDGDYHYLRELLTEHSDGQMNRLFAALWAAIATNQTANHAALGALMCDMAVEYLADEVDAATVEYMERAA